MTVIVVTTVVDGRARTRTYTDEEQGLAAVDRRITELRGQGLQRTGGHPFAGTIVTAHLRPTDRRRRTVAVVTAERV